MTLTYLMVYAILVNCTISLLPLISQMILYNKKGKHSWGALIPIYNEVLKFKIAGLSPWLVLLYLVPIANIVIGIIANVRFIKAYDKSTGFAVAALFLPVIFYPMVAFPIGMKEKPSKDVKKVNKVTYAVLTLLLGGIGINKFYAKNIKQGILSLVFCWTMIPTLLSMVEFVEILSEEKDKEGKVAVTNSRKTNVLFGAGLILFVLFAICTIIPWNSLFTKFTAFNDLNTWLGKIKIGKYSLFNNVIGAPTVTDSATGSSSGVINAIGTWSMVDISIFLFIVSAVIAFFNNIKFDEFIKETASGMKKVLPVAITAMLISIVLVISVTTGINITITNWIVSLANGFNIITITLASIIGSVLTADFYYFVSTIVAVFANTVNNTDLYGVIALISQSIYYLTMIIAPTSVALIIGLYYLNIPYGKWFKYIWKVLLSLFAIIVLATIIVFALV